MVLDLTLFECLFKSHLLTKVVSSSLFIFIIVKRASSRHGDRRMNMAVKARQQDPKISLLDALLQGGFTFPQLYTPGVKLSQVKDTDGVTVYQRKNQLNRRLREDRNKKKEKQKKK